MWDWLNKVFKKDEGREVQKPDTGDDGQEVKRQHVDLSEPRQLSPVDAPTILARLKTLGVLDYLDPNQEQALKRIVLTHCREKRVEMWWWSVCEFVRTRKTHKGELPFQVVDERCEMARSFKERLIGLEELFRAEGLQFRRIRSPDGEPLHDRAPLGTGKYLVKYRIGEREGMVQVLVNDGRIDVPAFIAQLNGIAQANRWGYRLVLLPPQDTVHCIVRCNFGTAERAERSQWGRVDYPE